MNFVGYRDSWTSMTEQTLKCAVCAALQRFCSSPWCRGKTRSKRSEVSRQEMRGNIEYLLQCDFFNPIHLEQEIKLFICIPCGVYKKIY